MISQEKKALRAKFSVLRNSITDIEAKSESIYNMLIGSDIYNNADTVLLYWSVGSEVITHRMIDMVISDGKMLAMPKCMDTKGNMLFYRVNSVDDLSAVGMFGIKEPGTDALADNFSCDSLCVVPGLSFSKDGFRLGYGKGYYDRFLENFPGVSVGLCYEECLTDYLPTDENDKKVNYIISNNIIIKIKEE